METNKAQKPEYIENQVNNNCQQFFGKVENCVFAMAGSHVGMPTSSTKNYCEYINREKLAEQGTYTLDEFEEMFAKATKGEAPELAVFLKKYQKIGILDFKGHSKRKIYDTLRAHFKEMRDYSYQNFTMAY